MAFAIITQKIQKDFENQNENTATAARIPMICGHCGRACRQMEKAEGANRANCMYCPLAKFAEAQTQPQPTQAPEEEPEEITVDLLRERLEAHPARSAWSRGVKMYAADLLEDLETAVSGGYFDMANLLTPRMLRAALLNGAADWNQFSWGGCSLIYNEDIAERLCTPSELKKTRHGERRPNAREEWLDTQARALFQAYNLIGRLARNI